MKKLIAVGMFLIVTATAAGCSSDDSSDAAASTSAEASSVSTSSAAPSSVASSSAETSSAEAAPTTAASAPEPAPTESDAPLAPVDGTAGATGEALYQQICTQFLPSIDALEQTGVSGRQQSANGLRSEMTSASSWASVPPADQAEILRGLEAAGAGQC